MEMDFLLNSFITVKIQPGLWIDFDNNGRIETDIIFETVDHNRISSNPELLPVFGDIDRAVNYWIPRLEIFLYEKKVITKILQEHEQYGRNEQLPSILPNTYSVFYMPLITISYLIASGEKDLNSVIQEQFMILNLPEMSESLYKEILNKCVTQAFEDLKRQTAWSKIDEENREEFLGALLIPLRLVPETYVKELPLYEDKFVTVRNLLEAMIAHYYGDE